jgi:hypothetical protein
LYTFRVRGLCPFLSIKLLFIKKKKYLSFSLSHSHMIYDSHFASAIFLCFHLEFAVVELLVGYSNSSSNCGMNIHLLTPILQLLFCVCVRFFFFFFFHASYFICFPLYSGCWRDR